jgi:hypothetical protein
MAYLFTAVVVLLPFLLGMAWKLRLFRWAVPATMLYTIVYIIASAAS